MKRRPQVDRSKHRTIRQRRGIILVIVMIVIVMVSLAGFGFVASMTNENREVHLRGEQLQMDYALASAEELLKQQWVPKDAVESPALQRPLTVDSENALRGVVVSDDGPNSRIRFTVVAPRFDDTGAATYRYGYERESAKLDLATVMEWEKRMPGAGRRALVSIPGITESIADAILDWMDSDNLPRESGAELEYYTTLNPSYYPRNGIPESLEELLLVKGITRSLLFGRDVDQNHRIDVEESSSSTSFGGLREVDGERPVPLVEILTLFSNEKNQTRDGKPRIDLNQPDLANLQQELSEAFDPDFAKYVVLVRQFGLASPTSAAAAPLASVPVNLGMPSRIRVASILDLVESKVQAILPSGVPTIVASPMSGDVEKLEQSLSKLYDRLSVVGTPTIRGRINLNDAPAEVLRAIPGFDKALAEQIIAARSQATKRDKTHDEHPFWLVSEGIVDLGKMKEILPYLTVGGDVYRAQIIAFSETSRLSHRIELVLDAAVSPARRVYWKDLQVLGRGYPWDVIDTPGGITTETGGNDAAPSRDRL